MLPAGDAEEVDERLERLGLRGHLLGGRRELLGGRGVALRDEVDLRERLVDLRDAGRLFIRRGGDLVHQLRRLADGRDEFRQQRARAVGDAHALRREGADLARRDLALFGELPDLVRDDGEAAAVIPCARRLDGGVQREEVRLVRDLFDDVDFSGDGLHRADGLDDGAAALLGVAGAASRHLTRRFAVSGVLGDRGIYLLEARRRFLDRRRLLRRTGGDGLRRLRGLAGGGRGRVRGGAPLADHFVQRGEHRRERDAEAVVLGARPDLGGEV